MRSQNFISDFQLIQNVNYWFCFGEVERKSMANTNPHNRFDLSSWNLLVTGGNALFQCRLLPQQWQRRQAVTIEWRFNSSSSFGSHLCCALHFEVSWRLFASLEMPPSAANNFEIKFSCIDFSFVSVFCAFWTGLSGCWRRSAGAITATAGLMLITCLLAAGAMGLWHTVEFYEKEKVVGEEFYQQWSSVLKDNTRISYDWSYVLAWAGVASSLIAAILLSGAAVCLRSEREKEEQLNLQYLMPGLCFFFLLFILFCFLWFILRYIRRSFHLPSSVAQQWLRSNSNLI